MLLHRVRLPICNPIEVKWLPTWTTINILTVTTVFRDAYRVFTPHSQRERGKVIGVGVHIAIYNCVYSKTSILLIGTRGVHKIKMFG